MDQYYLAVAGDADSLSQQTNRYNMNLQIILYNIDSELNHIDSAKIFKDSLRRLLHRTLTLQNQISSVLNQLPPLRVEDGFDRSRHGMCNLANLVDPAIRDNSDYVFSLEK